MRASTSSRPPRSPSSRPAEPAGRSPARLLAAALPRRLSTFPLLLAALAILAFAALVSTAPSADAHHDGDGAVAGNVVFETTLTVASFTGTRKGCSDYDADTDDKCSNQLAANSFTYKGSTYRIRYIAVDNAGIPDRETRIVLYQDMPAASTPWTLEIAGETYNWSDGTSVQSNKGRKWSAGASALQDGAQVTVRIIETPAVFETTLTVASISGTRKGCSDYDADADDKCSNQLAANSFTYKGSTYRIRYIAVDNAGIPDRETRIVFYQDMPAASTPWTLEIAGETYKWSDGTSVQSNKGRTWSAGASALQDGAQVTVRIIDTSAFFGTTLTASSSIPGLRGGCSDYDADADDKCSNQLAANSFAYRGSSYTFRHIAVDDANIPGGGPEVRIIFYEDMPPASTPWAFEIAGRTYRWNDGASVQSGTGRKWPTGGLTLQNGAEVPVRMIHTPVIWSAILTPQTTGSGFLGCDGNIAGKKCSQTALLTDDDFTYGESYEVYSLYTGVGKLFLQLNKDIPAALKAALTLKVGSASYPFADGTLKAGTLGSNSAIEWTGGPSLTSGIPVAVALEATRSTNANLSGLTAKSATGETAAFSALALSPSTFSAATTAYTASVAQNVTHVKLTPTKVHAGASIKVGKGTSLSAVTSGSESSAIALAEGANAIRVEVTAEDGTTKQTYTVTVTRTPGPPKVSLSADQTTVVEGDQVTITATLSRAPDADFSITATITAVTAESGDLTRGLEDKRIDFPAGVAEASFIIGTEQDDDTEDETFTLALGTLPSQVRAGTPTSLTIRILDDDFLTVALVSNVGQTSETSHSPLIDSNENTFIFAQQFTTGANSGGYTLRSIEFNMAEAVSAPANMRAELWSAATNGEPGSKLADLVVPLTVGAGNVAFYAPANTTLAASTKYFAVMYPTGATTGEWTNTSTDGEDTGAAAGWSIANGFYFRGTTATTWDALTDELKIRVNGLPVAPAAGASVWSATLTPRNVADSGDLGCNNTASGEDKCSDATTLTDDDFTYRGETYTIRVLTLSTSGELSLWLDKGLPAYAKNDLVLTAGTEELPLADFGGSQGAYGKRNSGLNWTAGTAVTLGLKQRQESQPTTVTLSASLNAVHEGEETIITATLSSALPSAVQMEATVTAGTAEPGDYTTLTHHPLDFPAGSTETSFRIQTNKDGDTDDETLIVRLGSLPSGVTAGATTSLTITITEAVFQTTLTASSNVSGARTGCSDYGTIGPQCTDRRPNEDSFLTAHSFAYKGSTYTFRHIAVDDAVGVPEDRETRIVFYEDMPPATTPWAFEIAGKTYRWNDGASVQSNKGRKWPTGGLTLQNGAQVTVRIVETSGTPPGPPPSDGGLTTWLTVTVEPGNGFLALSWNRPFGPNHIYEVNWKSSSAPDADATTPGDPSTGWVAPVNIIQGARHTRYATCCAWTIEGLSNGTTYDVRVRPYAYAGETPAPWATGSGAPAAPLPPSTLTLSADPAAIPWGGSVTVTARLDQPALSLMEVRFDTEGDDGAARWGPDCDWERGTINLIAAGQTETSRKLCATAGVTMTVTAGIGGAMTAPGIRVRALGPNPPTAITLSADPQAVANGGPVTVTARLDRPTEPGLTVNLGINGLGAAWWDHCDPPRRYRGTWGGKVIEIPAGGQEATAELCVRRSGGPPLEIWAWSDAPRLDAKTLSLLEPASLVLRSLTVSSTDPAEGLPENSVELSDASNDYTFSVPRAVSSVTVKPAAAYETTSVKVNGSAVDAATPAVDVPLDVGDNTISIEVRAPAVPAVREYTLTVTRMEASTDKETQVLERPECEADTGPLCGIALSAGSEALALSPDFARDTTSYRATVPAGTTSVTLTPDYAEGTSVFAGSRNGGTTYTRPTRVRPSGTAAELALAPDGGATELWLMVSGSGGMTTYSIHVTEATPEPKTYSVGAASTAAEGANATLTVTLSEAARTGGVALTVTAGYGGGSTATADDVGSIASPVTVPAGETALDITIPTVDDDVDEGNETFTVTISADAHGWEKAGDGRDTATVTITDDDTAGVTVTPTTLSVVEDGSGSYTITLDSRPTAGVTVTVTSGDDGAASVSPASYTFTPSGWNISQIFIVSGVADADTDDESVTISHGAASSDGKYNGIAVASVAVSVTDDTPEQQQQTAEPVETPGPVVNLQLLGEGKKVIVSWEAPASGGAVNNYIAHLKPADGGTGKTHRPQAGKTTTTFRNLEPGVTYKVWVRAQNDAGKGERVHARITLPE